MRIAIVCGALLWLVGCNSLPEEPLTGDDQRLSSANNAGNGGTDPPVLGKASADAGVNAGDVPNGTTEASANAYDPSGCELKAKECYANGNDPKLCDSILASCQPPAPAPGSCGRDCDAEVRGCFAKGVDAKTCDALYHECLSVVPGGGNAYLDAGQPANDPVTECLISAKECYAKNEDPALCDAWVNKCMGLDPGAPKPGTVPVSDAGASAPAVPADIQLECQLKYKGCLEANVDVATCDALLKQCSQL